MSIRKREWVTAGGVKKTAWQVDYRDPGGKRRSKQFPRKKDADAWLTQTAYDVSRGTHTADSASVTVARAAEIWLASRKAAKVETSTLAAYESIVRLHIVPLIGAERLNRLTKPRIEQFKDQLLATRTRAQAIRGVNHLRMIITEAERLGYVAHNVTGGVRIVKSSRDTRDAVIPTTAEIKAILDAASPTERPMVMTIVMTGVRASELRALMWKNVDLKAATISIETRADEQNKLGSPKSRAGRRKIPMAPSLVAALREWKLRCPPSLLGLVFPSPKSTIWSYSNLMNRVWWPLQVRAGVCVPKVDPADGLPVWDKDFGETMEAKYSLHAFRHAAASLWISQGIDLMRLKS
jgi:integrase